MADILNVICCPGGGTLGCFQGGAIEALTHNGAIEIHAMTGTSTGAIQAGVMAGAVPGLDAQKDRVAKLKDCWFALKSPSDIMDTSKWKGVLRAIAGKPAVSNLGPLAKRLEENLTDPKRPVVLTASDLTHEGAMRLRPKTAADLLDAVLASASVPVLFPPRGGLVDGGVRDLAPLASAFDLARELAPAGSGRPVRIFVLNPTIWSFASETDGADWAKAATWTIALRVAGMMQQEILRNDIQAALDVNELLKLLAAAGASPPSSLAGKIVADVVLISPTHTPYGSFDVEPERIRDFWRHGFDQAVKALA